MFRAFRPLLQKTVFSSRRFFGGHAHHGPNKWEAANKEFGIELHEPAMMHKVAANSLLLICWLWVLHRFKEDKGKLFGWHKPWLEAHHHEEYEWVDVELDDEENAL